MANHLGSEGLVQIGANTVAEVISWSIEETTDMAEDTQLSDADKTFKSDKSSWSGSLECHWDETDAAGQGALTKGASVTLNVKAEGNVTGDTFFTGTALVNSISRSSADIVAATFGFQGTGALAQSTV